MSDTKTIPAKNGVQLIERLDDVAQMDDGTLVIMKEGELPLKWKEVIYKSFLPHWKQDQSGEDGKGGLTSEQKKYLSKLASKVIRAKTGVNFSVEELATISEYVHRMYNPGVCGPLQNMIDGEYEDLEIPKMVSKEEASPKTSN